MKLRPRALMLDYDLTAGIRTDAHDQLAHPLRALRKAR
jgi:hypothetical protein